MAKVKVTWADHIEYTQVFDIDGFDPDETNVMELVEGLTPDQVAGTPKLIVERIHVSSDVLQDGESIPGEIVAPKTTEEGWDF